MTWIPGVEAANHEIWRIKGKLSALVQVGACKAEYGGTLALADLFWRQHGVEVGAPVWAVSLATVAGRIVGARALKEPDPQVVRERFYRAGIRFLDTDYPLESGASFVDPDWRGLGISSRQLRKLLGLSNAEGLGVHARTLEDNVPAIRLMERHDFLRLGRSYSEADGPTILWGRLARRKE